jgi:hypothetical protein
MKKFLAVVFLLAPIVSFAQSSATSRLLQEMETTNDGQKFFEIGGCYAALVKGAESGNSVFKNRVNKILTEVDLDQAKQKAISLANKSCPDRSDNCIFSKAPKGAAGFLAGMTKGTNTLKAGNTDEIAKWQDSLCMKHFKF